MFGGGATLFQTSKPNQNNAPTFGSATVTNTPIFGSSTTNQTSLFGANKTSNSAFSTTPSFNLSNTSTQPAFGLGFSANTSNQFGAKSTFQPFSTQNQTNQQIGNTFQQNQQISETELFLCSLSHPSICGDDRDIIIQRWNQLQAMYGYGTGLCSKGKVTYNSENPICRFKSVAFNQIPKTDDSDGYVALIIKKSLKEVIDNKIAIAEKVFQILNVQNIKVQIEDIHPVIKCFVNPVQPTQNKPTFGLSQPIQGPTITSNASNKPDEYSEIFIKIVEMLPTGSTRFVSANNLTAHFKNEPYKSKLTNELSIVDVVAHVSPSTKDISDYINGPAPRGLDIDLWEKAKQMCTNNNSNNEVMSKVPVPVIGMSELKSRMNGQIEFALAQLATLRSEAETVSEMKLRIVSMSSKIEQMKRKQMELSNRIMKILCRQELLRKQGYSLSAEEESVKCTLERMWNQIVGARGLKSSLQEIISTSKLNGSSHDGNGLFYNGFNGGNNVSIRFTEDYLSQENVDELKEYLSERQKSIKQMMTVLRENIACLDIIEKSY